MNFTERVVNTLEADMATALEQIDKAGGLPTKVETSTIIDAWQESYIILERIGAHRVLRQADGEVAMYTVFNRDNEPLFYCNTEDCDRLF